MSAQIKQIIEVVETIDKKKENRLKGVRTVNHMNTRTTKNTTKMAELMERDLQAEVRTVVELLDKNKTLDEIREKIGHRVGSIIANGVRESYISGLHFIEQFAERTIHLTPQMLTEIDATVKDNIERFWGRIDAELAKKTAETNIAGAAFDFDLFTKLSAPLLNSTISMNFFALNQSTVTTYKQMFKETALDGGVTVTGSIEIPKLIWITERDNRVCPICLPMDGETWFVDEPNIPRPVQDTHIGCRCRLLPKSKGKVFNA